MTSQAVFLLLVFSVRWSLQISTLALQGYETSTCMNTLINHAVYPVVTYGNLMSQHTANKQRERLEKLLNCTFSGDGGTPIRLAANSIRQGKKAAHFNCPSEGFHASPYNCQTFYRCVDMGSSNNFLRILDSRGRPKLTAFQFHCGPDTVFDPAYAVCNHPHETTRIECGGRPDIPLAPQAPPNESDNEVDNVYTPQNGSPGYPQTSNTPVQLSTSGNVSPSTNAWSPTDNEPKTSTISETPAVTSSAPLQTTPTSGNQNEGYVTCTNEGFYPTPGDCKKFYRCVPNQNRGYTKYDFTCGEGTVWDSDNNVCNHDWAVRRSDCGKGGSGGEAQSGTSPTQEGVPGQGGYPGQGGSPGQGGVPGQGGYPGQGGSSEQGGMPGQGGYPGQGGSPGQGGVPGQGGYPGQGGAPGQAGVPGQGGYPGQGGSPGQGGVPGQGGYPGQGGSPGQGGVPGQGGDPGQSSPTTPDTAISSTPNTPGGTSASSNICTSEGFFPESSNCKKFFRCVDNGKGAFTKYDFACGEGTVWDPESNACNHNWAVQRKDCRIREHENGAGSISEQKNNTQTTTPTSVENQKSTHTPGGSTFSSPSITTSSSSSSSSSSSATTQSQSSSSTSTSSSSSNESNQESTTSSGSGGQTATSSGTGSASNENNELTMTTSGIHQQSTQSSISSGSNQQATSSECNQQSGNTSTTSSSQHTQQSSGSSTSEQASTTGSEHSNTSGSVGSSTGQEGQTTVNQSQEGTTHVTPESSTSTTPTPGISTSEGGISPSPEGNTCTSEGFFPTPGDCKKFHRCVGNGKGGFTKYDFKCGDGTVWDPANDVCNHEHAVRRDCNASGKPGGEGQSTGAQQTENNSTTSTAPDQGATAPPTGGNQGNSTSTAGGESGTSIPGSEESATTPNGQGSSSTIMNVGQQGSTASGGQESSSTPGDGPSSITNPSNGQEASTTPTNLQGSSTGPAEEQGSSTAPISSQEGSTTPSGTGSSNTSDSQSPSSTETAPCNQQTTLKPSTGQIKCEKDGYYPHPTDCKKFYRCVDWDGDKGKRFSVYYFDCPDGTIFDPSLSVCNHAQSVYPFRECSGNSTGFSEKPTSAPQTTTGTKPAETTSVEASSETPTATTEAGTPEQASGTSVTTTEGETTTVTPTGPAETTVTNVVATNTSGETETTVGTTDQETTGTSGAGSTVTDSPTSTTNQEASSTAGTATEEATTSTNEETAGTVGSTGLITTVSSAQETTNPAESSNTETTNPTEETGTTSGTTSGSEQSSAETTGTASTPEVGSSTENPEENNITTEGTPPAAGGGGQCPTVGELDQNQIVVVCPTGFRRHPKYCNLFYQCTTSGPEMNILVLACTNNTVFDDKKIQCLPPEQAAPCQGTMTGGRFNRKVAGSSDSMPVPVNTRDHLCPGPGYYPYDSDCSRFYKCRRDSRGKLEGYMYECPPGYAFWEISRRCEKLAKLPSCARGVRKEFPQAPIERRNVGSRKVKH
ncbi:hypothetical protein Cfor_03477 [Coptotermes formosanus]|uniref:Chitin-binding type-2 domain-containing protein n=1 Tax=Coptotermes formosanus TaxID=36987 RepID=A0A6L2PLV0_COPFO|nr:hypothetical protein Cfor_03477 [Coptotermes formosanus]